MKATLRFDLDDPYDRESHMRALKATDAYHALHTITEILRRLGDDEVQPAMEALSREILAAIEDAGVHLHLEYT